MKAQITLLFLLIVNFSVAQSTHTVTVGGESPDFETISLAFEAVEEGTISPNDGHLIINVRPGTYNGRIHLTGGYSYASVTLQSESLDNSTVTLEATDDWQVANFIIENTQNLSVRHLTFKNLNPFPEKGILELVGSNSDIEITNCRFETSANNVHQEGCISAVDGNLTNFNCQENYFMAGRAISLGGNNNSTLKINENYFDSVFFAVSISNALDVELEENYLYYAYEHGFHLENSGSISILKNKFDKIAFGDGIRGNWLTGDVVVSENEMIGGYSLASGIELSTLSDNDEYSRVVVEQNKTDFFYAGVYITNFDEVTINKNLIQNPFGYSQLDGIWVSHVDGEKLEIKSNEILGSGLRGITVRYNYDSNSTPANKYQIVNNMVGNREVGIQVQSFSGHLLIANNSISLSGAEAQNAFQFIYSDVIYLVNNAVKFYPEQIEENRSLMFFEGDVEFESGHNVFDYDTSAVELISSDTTFSFTDTTLLSLQQAGIDLNSQIAPITFYNDSTDLRTCGENLIGAGLHLGEVDADFFGTVRPEVTPSVGAHEVLNGGLPIVDFEINASEFDVNTENLTHQGESYLWEFGDGFTSSEFEPSYIYEMTGSHYITLTATNNCGSSADSVLVTLPGIFGDDFSSEIRVFPNPTKNKVTIESTSQTRLTRYELFDYTGRKVNEGVFSKSRMNTVTLDGESGIYVLRIFSEGGESLTRKLVKQ